MQVMGYYLVFRLRQLEVKSEVRIYLKSNTDDKHLTHFNFTIKDGHVLDKRFIWEEDNEFEFAGKMYDVIEQTIKGNKLMLRCLEDQKETDLIKTFGQFQKSQSQNGKSKSISLLHFFGSLYVVTEITSLPSLTGQALASYLDYHSPLIDRSREILTPPPKNC
jgi:hypothetical protein